MIGDKEYLGDAVYVRFEHGGLMLTTENGIKATNEIFLEPEVYKALLDYVERLQKQSQKPATREPPVGKELD